jgi:hypothetical protein
MVAAPAPAPVPRPQLSPAVFRAARNGSIRHKQMRPRANTVSCSSPRSAGNPANGMPHGSNAFGFHPVGLSPGKCFAWAFLFNIRPTRPRNMNGPVSMSHSSAIRRHVLPQTQWSDSSTDRSALTPPANPTMQSNQFSPLFCRLVTFLHHLLSAMGPQVVAISRHASSGTAITVGGDELISDMERRRVRRTLSLHGRDLFATVMASPGASPRASPRLSPQMPGFFLGAAVAQVDEGPEVAEDDGWAKVPTKKQKAKRRQAKQKERSQNPASFAAMEQLQLQQQQQQQQGGGNATWYDDHFEHDDAVELYYEHAETINGRQVGSSKKANNFKAAQKRSYAIDKRNKQRGR